MTKCIDLVGKQFGRLTGVRKCDPVKGRTFWEFDCSCGNKTKARGDHVRNGRTNSCGCIRGYLAKHGMSKTRIYHCWQAMKERCNNKLNPSYNNYGGRGITVCDQWLSFEVFFADMGLPEDSFSIDRIDNDGPYCKSNCRWATRKEQACNRRNSLIYTLGEKTQCLKDWSRELGIPYTTLIARVKRGIPFCDAISFKC